MPERLIRIEGPGKLLVCTDLQGNLGDFLQVIRKFRELVAREPGSHLILTGDLVHGPEYSPEEWPDYLGTYYFDDSPGVIHAFEALREEFPGQVHALLGNHEHAHVGGPVVSKFFLDEAAHLENRMGPEGAQWLRRLLRDWPVVAVTSSGAVLTHGAPAVAATDLTGPENFVDLCGPTASPGANDLSGYERVPLWMMAQSSLLGALLWARSASPEEARHFVRMLGGTFSVFGHDIVREGYLIMGDEQICVSTSFGLFDADKTYLEIDLAHRYESVRELEPGREIRKLYP